MTEQEKIQAWITRLCDMCGRNITGQRLDDISADLMWIASYRVDDHVGRVPMFEKFRFCTWTCMAKFARQKAKEGKTP